MNSLPPWTSGPFELIVHGERHLRGANDFDRRIALISFDNAIEVTIATYLTLNPIQRGGRSYKTDDVAQWMKNYHAKLDFLEEELKCRKISWKVEKAYIIWTHDQRNEQYHGGHKGTPEITVLEIAKTAALWVFSVLFDITNVEEALDQAVFDQSPPVPPSRERRFDLAIDEQYGIMEVAEQYYYVSELLFAVDYDAYTDLGGKLIDELMPEDSDETKP